LKLPHPCKRKPKKRDYFDIIRLGSTKHGGTKEHFFDTEFWIRKIDSIGDPLFREHWNKQPLPFPDGECYLIDMPTVMRKGPYRFHFYSDEGSEPPHIHVACGNGEVKFWLDPIRMASNVRLASSQIREIERLVFEYQRVLLEAYHEFHS
jgi:hypothetical protein